MSAILNKGPVLPHRRELLKLGAASTLGAFWAPVEAACASPGAPGGGRARSVIMIFNCGAPSHLDLWDPKPQAPDNIRSTFGGIATNVPGIRVTELLPRLARHAEKLAIVRSVHHRHSAHNSGMYWSIAGRPYPMDSTLINPSRVDLPSFGTLVGWLAQRDGYSGPLPPYVITPLPHCDSLVYLTPGQMGGCLGARYDPLVVGADPNAPQFQVPNLALREDLDAGRLTQRQALLHHLEGAPSGSAEAMLRSLASNRQRATAMVTSPEVRRAFDLSREPGAVRERYGRHSWGQSHLLARRLVEAGVRFVSTVNGPSIVWDTHQNNFDRLQNNLAPPMDRAFSALLDDLHQRGLLDSTLVIWMGDFGRTPLINNTVGRDHWPHCYTMVLAGAGIRGGQYYGESDSHGAYPREHPVTPADVHATIFTALGYDPHAIHYLNAEARPYALSEGRILRELLAFAPG